VRVENERPLERSGHPCNRATEVSSGLSEAGGVMDPGCGCHGSRGSSLQSVPIIIFRMGK
jgi:hypothetical protein